MDIYTATEEAYKKGYEDGKRDSLEHGQWEYDPNGCDWGIGAWRCSKCGLVNNALPFDNKLNPYWFIGSHYCPCCGAKMEGDANGT